MAARRTPAKRPRRAPEARGRGVRRGAAETGAVPAQSGEARPRADSAAATGVRRIQGPLLIHDVMGRAAQLREALDAGLRSFDLGGVSAIDTAGVQLLLALAREAARRQSPLRLSGCTSVVLPAMRALGLAPELEPLISEAV